jgi:hypothetical protein
MRSLYKHTHMNQTISSKRDVRRGEGLLRQLWVTAGQPDVEHSGDLAYTQALSQMHAECIAAAWDRMTSNRCNRRMKVRALRQIKQTLLQRGKVGLKILQSLPHRVPSLHKVIRPDPLLRQRRIIEEDAVPARVTTPWIRELLLYILHHPNRVPVFSLHHP